ncbi:MAG: hypothetical protein AVDCRST_MAG20-1200 [uncultured Acidimicrobiales bacterium]|uniref:Uncharacterized protein n=1 Tax=uncultured Acidimicrobiales bacterium TaxID=310071 RepID=A0A6J4HQM3_9ACTN|nr:MAG: hypothetical protein AVDCRST_MAG20-1200 [uncultured Acidimicrobiales bacterium]
MGPASSRGGDDPEAPAPDEALGGPGPRQGRPCRIVHAVVGHVRPLATGFAHVVKVDLAVRGGRLARTVRASSRCHHHSGHREQRSVRGGRLLR